MNVLLDRAVENEDVIQLKSLLDVSFNSRKAAINYAFSCKKEFLLSVAISNNRKEAFRQLIDFHRKHSIPLNSKSSKKHRTGKFSADSPLSVASHLQKLDFVKSLLEHGAYPDSKNADGKTSLHAVLFNLTKTEEDLRESFSGQYYNSICEDAIKIIQTLIGYGASPHIKDAKERDSFDFLLDIPQKYTDRIKTIFTYGQKGTIIEVKAKTRNKKKIQDQNEEESQSEYNYADHEEKQKEPKKTKLKNNAKNVFYACSQGDKNLLIQLIQESKNGLNLNAQSSRGLSPLHHAVSHGFRAIIDILLENGASLHAQNNRGTSLLHAAVEHDHLHIVKFLLDSNYSLFIKNSEGFEPLELAIEKDMT